MKECEVCELNDYKYRCPTCRILYCSVGCFKTHKDKCEDVKLIQDKELSGSVKNRRHELNNDLEPGELTGSESENEDKVGQAQLHLLENSKSVKDMLQNKHLRRIIKNIDGNINPQNELESAMRLPIFAEFADECLNIVEGETEDNNA